MTELGDVDVRLRALDLLGADLARRAVNVRCRRCAGSAAG
jgi:hypothetical protein